MDNSQDESENDEQELDVSVSVWLLCAQQRNTYGVMTTTYASFFPDLFIVSLDLRANYASVIFFQKLRFFFPEVCALLYSALCLSFLF